MRAEHAPPPIATPQNRETIEVSLAAAQLLIHRLLSAAIIVEEDWERLSPAGRTEILGCHQIGEVLPVLTRHGLLTPYQAERINQGDAESLVLGNYRILEPLGAGGMSVVYKAEQRELRRDVAIKVLTTAGQTNPRGVARFAAEMRAVARLQHPNIVAAIDAGTHAGPGPDAQPVRYFVMEYVPGQDLEKYVAERGPLPLALACDLIHQIASALEKANEHNLVHRDIKPSNIRVTPEGQAKLVDFGLARQWDSGLTVAGALLGTLDFMAPEQAKDAATVDIRADIFALGGTLFWCLTGRLPFPVLGTMLETAARRMTQAPPSARSVRPDLPPEIDTVLARMMAIEPGDRFPTPRAVMRALVPFLKSELRDAPALALTVPPKSPPSSSATGSRTFHVLIADDNVQIREFCRYALQSDEIQCDLAINGMECLEAFRAKAYDLVLLDIDMPELTGPEVLRRLRRAPPVPLLKVIMFSGRASPDEMAQVMNDGADDFLTKPFSIIQLKARVRAALRLKSAQEQSNELNQYLIEANRDLEQGLCARARDLDTARNALAASLAGLVVLRACESQGHLRRVQRYCRRVAEAAAGSAAFAGQVDAAFIDMLECCAPLHDLGLVVLPEHILMKPGKLNAEDRFLIQTHTTLGADLLRDVAKTHDFAKDFFQMTVDVIRHHHERFDGKGFPDRLAGAAIPLSARIVRIADVYDALRSRRIYKPALSHAVAVELITERSAGQFDPALVELFQKCAAEFERIFRETPL